MPTQTSKQKSAWENRFEIPKVDALVSGLNHQMQCVANHARRLLVEPGCIRESVAWQGVWKWCLTYTLTADANRNWAFVIPDPTKLRICIPVASNVLAEMPLKKLPRFVRDVIVHSPQVGLGRWPVWEVQTKAQAEEVLHVCELQLNILHPKPLAK